MNTWIFPYQLSIRDQLSVRSQSAASDDTRAPHQRRDIVGARRQRHDVVGARRQRDGVLVKHEWGIGEFGFSDLHPWPEFGELELSEQIRILRTGGTTPLLERSLELNQIDARARAEKRSLFFGLTLPQSHRLIMDVEELTSQTMELVEAKGFRIIKLKMGRDLDTETKKLKSIAEKYSLKWRLDFNGRVTAGTFTSWWQSLPEAFKAKIDFVEDPCAEDSLGIDGPWASDWRSLAEASIRILKPARDKSTRDKWTRDRSSRDKLPQDKVASLDQYQRVLFTHSLDHPLGQAFALWQAAQSYQLWNCSPEICGLAAPECYQPDMFSEYWHSEGPVMFAPSGLGIGFDEILARLPWQRLN